MPGTTGISTVNLAARQRMLSQRMILQTMLAAQGGGEQLQAAARTLALFNDSQTQLLQVGPATAANDPGAAQQLHAVYHGTQGVGPTIERFSALVHTVLQYIRQRDARRDQALAELVAQTDKVLDALNKATTAFDDISKAKSASMVRELTGIVNDIQNVAREAKVVSFNALVIAARAGQFGREFAVVANVLTGITGKIDGLSREAVVLAARG